MTAPTGDRPNAFAAALRAAVSERGITLARLRQQLADDGNAVSMATLSYWRSGARQPEGAQSLGVVEGIEDRLRLRRGHLSALLGPSARLGAVPPPRLPFDEERENRETAETLAALRSSPQDVLRDLSTQMTVQVGAEGAVESIVMRSLVQATHGIITELPLVDVAPEETEALSVISDVVGGRIDREYLHPGRLLSGVVIALDEPITVGDTTLVEFTETFPPGYPPRQSAWHATSRPARETLIWVRFHPDAQPSWCEEYVETEDDYVCVMRSVRSGSVHVSRHGFGPGVLGIRWGYDGDPEPGHSRDE
ncbi:MULTISPECIES: hypothetical protein [unclassified Microbacterium]|uniref:hypothetical protein n=1 Tax=unclassified Microbacterium TaxID=2609290 RepID=UPI000CFC092D|nr:MULTISPECIES: hypothetical protein [unclassified Microbacterium]PQZ55050.1 hypothetical protein CQ032_12200 [Microbacterium sp. MYb43]PQZ81505.1 hypothetical protein CQ031_04615 [Microbacterium sp. MYb40]PRB21487.1 hypothetical protein CQ040_09010 [Microbacterium sp. MYb54]PRB30052.1 hypothetical protein CQ037_06630 [Microbacterium sp. MYb50]PRB67790.1 hypothetical protein CQ021_07345 [Microbacterium sp. MYb24]